jgi:gamma-glutamylcyclotransferase
MVWEANREESTKLPPALPIKVRVAMKLYFAYGSNLWEEQMKRRCPQSRKLGTARLPGYRWIISARGYASVVASENEEVLGTLYEISSSDEAFLDEYEGVSDGIYYKAMLPVMYSAEVEEALVYIDSVTQEGEPKAEYIHRINCSLNVASLPPAYVIRTIRRFVPEM